MNDKKLRERLNKIREAMKIITNQINFIYNDNAKEVDKLEGCCEKCAKLLIEDE